MPLHSIRGDGTCSCQLGADCTHPGKHPRTPQGVKNATTSKRQIRAWRNKWPRGNIGIATGRASGVIVIDVDGPEGKESLRAWKAQHGPLPKTLTVRTARGRHYYFRIGDRRIRNSAGRLGEGIDVRGDGGYAVGPGSIHESGFRYRFAEGRGFGQIEIARAPQPLLDAVAARDDRGEAESAAAVAVAVPEDKLNRTRAFAEAARQRELERLAKAPNHQRNDTLNRCAFKLGQFLPYGVLDEHTLEADLARVAATTGLEPAEIGPTIKSGLTAGSKNPRRLPFLNMPKGKKASTTEPGTKSADALTKELARLGQNDTDNAERFARRFGGKVICTPGRGYLMFDGKRWQPDGLFQVMELAKATARLIKNEAQYIESDADRAGRAKFAESCLSKGALDRMLDLAKGLLGVEDQRLDGDPWLFNTETGTIDLRTGRREKHDPRDLLTKIAPVAAGRRAKCPAFKKFLRRVTGGDKGLMAYIQKAIGCSLTGITSEQVLFFVYGRSGNNGKSTLVNLIRDMLGEYGAHTPTETLLVKQYDNAIPADLARLGGVRMVTAIEANFNRQLDEAKIKGMTGGEPITARFMRQNFFEFTPAFKLWLVANDRPRVRGTDDAFWRRVKVIPFEVEIPHNERDPRLPQSLRAECPGILAWAVRGCLKWQAEGLAEPLAVIKATGGWRQSADHVKRFVNEAVMLDPNERVMASVLHDRYGKWCAHHGEKPLTAAELKRKLQDSFDLTHKRTKRGSDWIGVTLKS